MKEKYCKSKDNVVDECDAPRERSSTPFTEDEVEDKEARDTIVDCKIRIAKAEQVIMNQ